MGEFNIGRRYPKLREFAQYDLKISSDVHIVECGMGIYGLLGI